MSRLSTGLPYCLDCSFGTYADVPGSTNCKDAPKGVDLAIQSKFTLLKGYWRQSSESYEVLPCLRDEACTGGTFVGDEVCGKGFAGPLCAVCAENHFRSGQYNCADCGDTR